MNKALVPYDIEPGWTIESGGEPKCFCRGCGAEIEDANGFNTQHGVIDCLQELRRRLTEAESEIEIEKRRARK